MSADVSSPASSRDPIPLNEQGQTLVLPLGAAPSGGSRRGALRGARLIASIMGGLLFGLAVGATVVVLLATQFFGFKILSVQTSSMEPALSPGDLVIVRPAAIEEIKERDIVLFQDDTKHVQLVHRVAAIHRLVTNFNDAATGKTVDTRTDIRLLTQGDANLQPDPDETTPDTLKGRVWFSIPRLGQTTDMPLQTALFGFAGLVAVAWVSWELFTRFGKKRPTATAGEQE